MASELDLDPRVRVVEAGPRMELYVGGRRRILPPLVFGAGVLWHLLRHGRRYDVVHTCAFPYFSLLAAALVRPLGRYGLVADWFEVWSRDYWRGYLGGVGGSRRRARATHVRAASPNARSASPSCTPNACGSRARAGRSRSCGASTPARPSRRSRARPTRSCCSPGA